MQEPLYKQLAACTQGGASTRKRRHINHPTHRLHALGQSLWLDGISRDLLHSGTLARYIAELSVTGSTSNASLFEQTIVDGQAYDDSIGLLHTNGLAGEDLVFALVLQDLTQAAELFRPVFQASLEVDGWVSLQVSPLLADNTAHTIHAASNLFERAALPNLLIEIPGTPEGMRAVEEALFDGVPVSVTQLFSSEHYLAAAQANMRAIERRLLAGLDPGVQSVVSLCVGGWDVAVNQGIAAPLRNRLGITMAMRTYRTHRDLLASERWQTLAAAGARPQRLLWAGTCVKDAAASDTLVVQTLVAAQTITALSQATLLAFADHGEVGTPMLPDGGDADAVLQEFRRAGVDEVALAQRLQRDSVESAATSWHAMLLSVRQKCAALVP